MKKIFNPPFLQNIDRWLMLHKPSLWKTNLHYVIYYTLISLFIQTIVAVLYPVDFTNMVNVDIIYATLIIPALICVVLWIIKMVRYNIHHTNVKQSILQEVGVFSFNFIALLLIVSQLYVMPTIFNWRNAHTITQEQNLIIDKGLFFMGDEMSNIYNYKTSRYDIDGIRDAQYDSQTNIYTLSYNTTNRLGAISLKLDNVQFVDLIEQRDTSYFDTNTYYQYKIEKHLLIQHLDQFKRFHNEWFPNAKIKLKSDQIISNFIMRKKSNAYDSLTTETYDYEWKTQFDGDRYRSRVRYIDYVNDLIEDVDKSKIWDKNIFDLKYTIRATLWLIASLSFLLWLITLVRWQHLIITIVVFALSPILITIIGALLFVLLNIEDDNWGAILAFVTYLFFFIQAIRTNYYDRITPYKNVVTIVITILFPIVPLFLTLWSWQEYFKGIAYYDDYHEYRLIFGIEYHKFEDGLYIIGEGLMIVFVFLAIAIFGNILKKQLAKPRNN